jgi:beta-glucosidase
VLENGIYGLKIGASSEDIRLIASVEIAGEPEVTSPYVDLVATAYRKWISPAQAADPSTITDAVFEALLQRPIPQAPPKKPLRMESILSDFKATWMGKVLFSAMLTMATRQRRQALRLPPGTERDNRLKGALFLERVLSTNSPRSLSMNAGTQMPYTMAQGLVALANGHLFEAVKCFLRKEKVPPLPRQE